MDGQSVDECSDFSTLHNEIMLSRQLGNCLVYLSIQLANFHNYILFIHKHVYQLNFLLKYAQWYNKLDTGIFLFVYLCDRYPTIQLDTFRILKTNNY